MCRCWWCRFEGGVVMLWDWWHHSFLPPPFGGGGKEWCVTILSPSPLGGGGKEWCDKPYLPNACLPPDTPLWQSQRGDRWWWWMASCILFPITWDFKKWFLAIPRYSRSERATERQTETVLEHGRCADSPRTSIYMCLCTCVCWEFKENPRGGT